MSVLSWLRFCCGHRDITKRFSWSCCVRQVIYSGFKVTGAVFVALRLFESSMALCGKLPDDWLLLCFTLRLQSPASCRHPPALLPPRSSPTSHSVIFVVCLPQQLETGTASGAPAALAALAVPAAGRAQRAPALPMDPNTTLVTMTTATR